MRQDHVRGLKLVNRLLQRLRIRRPPCTVREAAESTTWTAASAAWLELGSRIGGLGAQHDRFDRLIAGQLLSRGHRLPRRAMQLAALLLGDDEIIDTLSRRGGPIAPRRSRLIRSPSLHLSVSGISALGGFGG